MIFDVCMYAGVFRQRGPHQAAYCLCVYVYMYIGMIFDVYVCMYVCMYVCRSFLTTGTASGSVLPVCVCIYVYWYDI